MEDIKGHCLIHYPKLERTWHNFKLGLHGIEMYVIVILLLKTAWEMTLNWPIKRAAREKPLLKKINNNNKPYIQHSGHLEQSALVTWGQNWFSWPTRRTLCVTKNLQCTPPWLHYPHRGTWWWQHHVVGDSFLQQGKGCLELMRRWIVLIIGMSWKKTC